MVLGPSDLQVLSPDDEANLKKIEQLLDEKLQTNFDVGGEVRLNISNMADSLKCRLTNKMLKTLMHLYIAAGWDILPDSTSNAEFFTFSEPKVKTQEEIRDATMIPDISTNSMLDKMAETGASQKESGPVYPFKSLPPTSRGDYDDPYSRKKLNSRP